MSPNRLHAIFRYNLSGGHGTCLAREGFSPNGKKYDVDLFTYYYNNVANRRTVEKSIIIFRPLFTGKKKKNPM